jgi:hypothetical protein
MKTSRVLILQENSLLTQALASVFRGAGNGQFRMVTSAAEDFQALVMDISELDPDYILLEESTPLASKNMLVDLLTFHPGLQVIVISKDSNWLHIYQKKNILLTKPEDLLTALSTDRMNNPF